MAPLYRDDERVLLLRLEALDAQLREAASNGSISPNATRGQLDGSTTSATTRGQLGGSTPPAAERRRLEAERAEIVERLEALGERFSLEGLRVASPCEADWDTMRGDDRTRFCSLCQKNVYNLSGMKRADAEALVRKAEGDICIRMYRRADGTVLTSDCPEGLAERRQRRLPLIAGPGAVVAASTLACTMLAAGVPGQPLKRPMPVLVVGLYAPTPPPPPRVVVYHVAPDHQEGDAHATAGPTAGQPRATIGVLKLKPQPAKRLGGERARTPTRF